MNKRWDTIDPKQLEIKTLSVENTLTPLVMQVSLFFFKKLFCLLYKQKCRLLIENHYFKLIR